MAGELVDTVRPMDDHRVLQGRTNAGHSALRGVREFIQNLFCITAKDNSTRRNDLSLEMGEVMEHRFIVKKMNVQRFKLTISSVISMLLMTALLAMPQIMASEYLCVSPFAIYPALGKGISAESAVLSTLMLFSEAKAPNKLKILKYSKAMETRYEQEVMDSVDFYMLPSNMNGNEIRQRLGKHMEKLGEEYAKSGNSYGIAETTVNGTIPANLPLLQASLEKSRRKGYDMRDMCRQTLRESFLQEDVRLLDFSPARARALLQLRHPFMLLNAENLFICVLAENDGNGTALYGYDIRNNHSIIEFTGTKSRKDPLLTKLSTDGYRMLYIPDLTMNTHAMAQLIHSFMAENGCINSYIERY